MTGLTPVPFVALKSCTAPAIEPWSVSETAGISSSAARFASSGMRQAPSRIEYSEWTCRWTKGAADGSVRALNQERLCRRERRERAGAGRGAAAQEAADDGAVRLRERARLAGERRAGGVCDVGAGQRQRRGRGRAGERAALARARGRLRPVRREARGERAEAELLAPHDLAGRRRRRVREARPRARQLRERVMVVMPAV